MSSSNPTVRLSHLMTHGVSPQEDAREVARQLVEPDWLVALVAGLPMSAAPAQPWRLFEVGYGGEAAFVQGHIPGAGYIDTGELERGPWWNKVPDHELLRVLLAHGICRDTTVILYGRSTLAAARAAHLMLYAGVADVRLLDGGLAAWQAAGCPMEAGAPHRYPALADFGARLPVRPDYLMDTEQARQLLQRQDGMLVSVRTWSEFVGRTSGYDYIANKGDIPGARWGRAGRDGDVHSMSDYQRPDGTMKPHAEIQAFWRQAGIHPGRRIAFYCGTGWRASLAFFYAWLMRWERISVYDGGWCEWSSDPANPVTTRLRCGVELQPQRVIAAESVASTG
ncbi:sulfurtransferase [Burkholderia sp. Bp8963]|uniref:sulfurtransferase n=1 Tax=Burkholderia sp. Bp8963 TaxID=2184547 RepID=UPI000F59B988|nr:rhodanese-like domain-containing protein [Burkholderia sp. Bp8963]RQS62932.1 sulfurtransferase [Burkholderia sp. Bp8963]